MLGRDGAAPRDLLARPPTRTSSDEAFPFATGQALDGGRRQVWANRMTYVGELGWELVSRTTPPAVFELSTRRRRPRPRQRRVPAIESLRLEKGFRAFGA